MSYEQIIYKLVKELIAERHNFILTGYQESFELMIRDYMNICDFFN